MNVLICFKWERDSEEATISHDGTLKWFNTNLKASDDDAAAISCARQIAAETESSLTAVTIGDGDATWAMARGASHTLRASTYMPGKDESVTAARLANAIKAAGEYDVILIGDELEHAGVAPITAALLGLPLVAGVADVAIDSKHPGYLIAHRATSENIETLKVKLPALISVLATSSEKNRPGMRQILAAKKLPVDELDMSELDLLSDVRLEVKETTLPDRRQVHMFEGSMSQTVSELVATLRANKIL